MAGASVHPVDDRIFVRRQAAAQNQTKDGIVIPETAESCLRGVVAACGPGMPTMDGSRMGLAVLNGDQLVGLQPGDGVIYPPDAAQEISMESGTFDVLNFRDVICVLRQEKQEEK